ncbi:MAG: RDD family protein [Nitrospinae bacterium]|nr:RDD family protein [Nitrospinota bacterium]
MDPEGVLGAKCSACGTVVKERREDPYDNKLFGVNLNAFQLKDVILAETGDKTGWGRATAAASLAAGWFIGRATRRPLVKPAFKGRLLKYSRTSLPKAPEIDKKLLNGVTSSLRGHGFIPVMDRVVDSLIPRRFERLFANKERKLYALALFEPPSERAEIMVIAPMGETGEKFAIASNHSPWILADPMGEAQFFPGAPVEELLAAADYKTAGQDRSLMKFSMKDFVARMADIHERRFDLAVKNKILLKIREMKKDEALIVPSAPVCENHKDTPAVAVCAACAKAVCLSCHNRFDGRVYCPECLPKEAKAGETPSLDSPAEGLMPAGLALRGSIKVFEFLMFAALLTVLFPWEAYPASKIVYSTMASVLFIGYFYYPVTKWGATPIQRLCGVAVVDSESGEPPKPASSLARTGYLLLSLVALFPFIGYLAAFKDPLRRGVHDRLAGTLVVTLNGGQKEKIGAASLIVMAGMLSLAGYQLKGEALRVAATALGGVTAPGYVSLPAKWRVKADSVATLNGPNMAAVLIGGELTAFDVATGKPLWISAAQGVERILADPGSSLYFVIGKKDGSGFIGAVSWKNGSLAWTAKLPGYPATAWAFTPNGLAVAGGDQVTAFDKAGKKMWSVPADGRITAITTARDTLIISVTGHGSRVISQRDGAPLSRAAGLKPVAPGAEGAYLFSGRFNSMTLIPSTGAAVWKYEEPLSFATEETYGGNTLFARQAAVDKTTGAMAFKYPEGCVCAGMIGKMPALTCPAERKLMVVDNARGRTLGEFYGIPRLDRVKLLWEDQEGYHLAATSSVQGDWVKTRLITLDHPFTRIKVAEIADFDGEPVIFYNEDRGALFISDGRGAGAYEAPKNR